MMLSLEDVREAAETTIPLETIHMEALAASPTLVGTIVMGYFQSTIPS
jgi:hypothetical protein